MTTDKITDAEYALLQALRSAAPKRCGKPHPGYKPTKPHKPIKCGLPKGHEKNRGYEECRVTMDFIWQVKRKKR